jgi:hypothetical protein
MTMVSPRTFYEILNKKGIKFTKCVNETRCPLHDEGPIKKKQLDKVEATIADLKSRRPDDDNSREAIEEELAQLEAIRLTLSKYIARYELHLEQYKAQRKYVRELLAKLAPGECVVFRDFVNSYNYNGGHIKNLQLVARWRDKVGGPLRTFKLANFCSDKATRSCDTYFYKDVGAPSPL